jgi:hypothetical protein
MIMGAKTKGRNSKLVNPEQKYEALNFEPNIIIQVTVH